MLLIYMALILDLMGDLMSNDWPLLLRLFHQEDQREHQQKHASQEAEDIVVREHRSLALNHAPDRNVSLAVGAHRVKSSGNKKLPQAGKRLKRARII